MPVPAVQGPLSTAWPLCFLPMLQVWRNWPSSRSTWCSPIASRCGVFAKTDVQALLNDGATSYDIAASVFQAVVNQTISGLTCGRPIKGKVVFLGGPLTFQPFLRACFTNTLNLSPENAVLPEHGELYVAIGSALAGMHNKPFALDPWLESIHTSDLSENSKVKTLPPLFRSEEDYAAFPEAPRGPSCSLRLAGGCQRGCLAGR